MHNKIDEIKKNESPPKVIKNLFSKDEINKFLKLYEQLPTTVHNKKQNVIKKRWLKEYGKELENFVLNKKAYRNANILIAGKLPAPAKIIQSEIVGPSLGAEAISSGYKSFLIALGFVLIYMIFYYMYGGIASNVALIINMFFMFIHSHILINIIFFYRF